MSLVNKGIPFKVRRTLVFVPGSVLCIPEDPLYTYAKNAFDHKLPSGYEPDALVFDLEDSVAYDHKEKSIGLIDKFLEKHKRNVKDVEIILRINAEPKYDFFDQEIALARKGYFDTVLIPKISFERLQYLENYLPLKEKEFIFVIETPQAYLERDKIFSYCSKENINVTAVCLGLDDFSGFLNVERNIFISEGGFTSFLANIVVLASAYNIQALGSVYNEPKNKDGLISEIKKLKNMGHDGSFCVFPQHVKLINDIYAPSPEEIEAAKQIIAGLDKEAEKGRGWCFYDEKKYDTADRKKFMKIISYSDLLASK